MSATALGAAAQQGINNPITQAVLAVYEEELQENPRDYNVLLSRADEYYRHSEYIRALADVRADGQMGCPVVGKTAVGGFQPRAADHHVGIGVQREQALPDHHVEHFFLIEQKHSVPVKITNIVG